MRNKSIKHDNDVQAVCGGSPNNEYMETIGTKCPDYWTHISDDKNGNSICQNTFNIPVNGGSKCMKNIDKYCPDGNCYSFDKIKKWKSKKIIKYQPILVIGLETAVHIKMRMRRGYTFLITVIDK